VSSGNGLRGLTNEVGHQGWDSSVISGSPNIVFHNFPTRSGDGHSRGPLSDDVRIPTSFVRVTGVAQRQQTQ
jgi:hypothetical protein